jgi:hypothetical protein
MGKFWFHLRKIKKIILQILTFLAILYLKNMFRVRKKIRLSRAAAAVAVDRNLCRTYSLPLKS